MHEPHRRKGCGINKNQHQEGCGGLIVSGWRSRSGDKKKEVGLEMAEARFWASQECCKQALTAHHLLFLH